MADPISTETIDRINNILNDTPEVPDEDEGRSKDLPDNRTDIEDKKPNKGTQSKEEEEDDLDEDDLEDDNEDNDEDNDNDEDEDGDDEDDGDDTLTDEDLKLAHIVVDGEKLNLKELKDSYLRQADYTRKSQDLAALKRAQEEEFIAKTAEADKLVNDRFNMVALDVEKRLLELDKIDWRRLAAEKPDTYVALKAEYDSTVHEARQLESEFKALQAETATREQESLKKIAEQSFKVLTEEIPQWSKDTYLKIAAYAIKNGYTEAEMAKTVEASKLIALYKAMKYDESTTQLAKNVKPKEKRSAVSKIKNKASPTSRTTKAKGMDNIRSKLSKASSKTERNNLSTALVANLLAED